MSAKWSSCTACYVVVSQGYWSLLGTSLNQIAPSIVGQKWKIPLLLKGAPVSFDLCWLNDYCENLTFGSWYHFAIPWVKESEALQFDVAACPIKAHRDVTRSAVVRLMLLSNPLRIMMQSFDSRTAVLRSV